jgi:hydrogenase expression/formation protein HypC
VCIGVPLQVTAVPARGRALCIEPGVPAPPRAVDTVLLESEPAVGDWLLVHVDVAVRAVSDLEAGQIGDALKAVTAAAAGQPFEHLLGDLIDREPELPPHLRTGRQVQGR